MTTIPEAEKLIKLARGAISGYFKGRQIAVSEELKKEFGKKQGVFVSIYVGDELNGCIGYPQPDIPLCQGVASAALAAAFEDPRFLPLEKGQIKDLRVELSILSVPEEIKAKRPEDYLKQIKIGEDGLIARYGMNSGLLLPQVAVEWRWDAEMFLKQTCFKAGLGLDAWKDLKTKIYRFQAEVFTEEKGKVVKKL